ncbi:MAG: hypothetical protein IJI45_10950 [Anaerolineaceae bacterium]|nr:hypothetical protein [Anaerolineaceae bacterium]
MNISSKIKYFPKNSLKAYDGMSVTADVWDMAHTEHRDEMRAHILSMHKPGIICGLEIRANDPADHYIFISPGAAVDEQGRVIVVDQTIAYDFGDEGAGKYRLLLGYAERERENSETKVKSMQHEYIIAARQSLPKQPVVELARVTISDKGAVIRDAVDPIMPGEDELDLRYRQDQSDIRNTVHLAVITFPSDNDLVLKCWRVMVREMEQLLRVRIIMDMLHDIDERINDYNLVYIGAAGTFSPSDTQIALLKNYYNNGNGILMEGLDAEGGKVLKGIADSFKVVLADPEKAGFFKSPYFFRIPPEQIGVKHLYYGEKIIFCNDPLTMPWCGELNDELLLRDEIRTNLEWGANLVTYCAG